MKGALACWVAPLLMAQGQATFYAAYQDGLDAEAQGRWAAAAAAYQRAIELRPASAPRVITYGNNLLRDYAPHTRLARCLLQTGQEGAARIALERAAHYGEPSAARDALAQQLARKDPVVPATDLAPPVAHPPSAGVPLRPQPVDPPPAAPTRAPEAPLPTPPPLPLPAPGLPHAGPTSTSKPSNSPVRPEDAGVPALLSAPPAPSPTRDPGPPPQAGRPWWVWLTLPIVALGAFGLLRRRRLRSHADASYRDPVQVGPYRIERLLGRGGFASTYLAQHTGTRALVALKLLHPYRHDDPEFLRRFRQEARLGTMLDHPNVVRMVDPGPEAGAPWLAMAFISGPRLDQVLRERGPLSLVEILRIARQIASAMAHAHSLGIVHRDLKPGNIIFDGDRPLVMDFGISRIVDSTTLTTTYAFLGTPKYAAPEAQLKAQVGPAADRYAFGIMLFELLTGRPPFEGETPFEILDLHQRAALPDLRGDRPDCPAGLADLIERLCRKAPEGRPGDEELLATLEQIDKDLRPED